MIPGSVVVVTVEPWAVPSSDDWPAALAPWRAWGGKRFGAGAVLLLPATVYAFLRPDHGRYLARILRAAWIFGRAVLVNADRCDLAPMAAAESAVAYRRWAERQRATREAASRARLSVPIEGAASRMRAVVRQPCGRRRGEIA